MTNATTEYFSSLYFTVQRLPEKEEAASDQNLLAISREKNNLREVNMIWSAWECILPGHR